MGNTCKPMADSFQCMTKSTTIKKKKKESVCSVGDLGSIPGLGRAPGEGKGHPLQYSDLENSMDYIVHGAQRVRHDRVTCIFLICIIYIGVRPE